ncbi:hypothetical protein [Bacteroides thetaiotaomicron]|uniref:hypothetical protein n=1 Tax=Bacteroides thetaiotaomicron TaxID=818 RepID=UPI0028F44FBF|nr:hypothetical protein [Bacteroides thetaiotaomicron]WOG18655.1 hypothetical protein RJT07_15985 [Bacteroides thetaiotaomicron]
MRQPCSVGVLPEAGFHLQCLSVGQCFTHRAAFPASRRYLTGARKAALRQWTPRNIPTDRSRKLLWLGDYRKLLPSGAFGSVSRSHPGKPDHKRQPMRW